ncbi:MAG: RNA polymerase sigma factor [Chitinophagales bacterium]
MFVKKPITNALKESEVNFLQKHASLIRKVFNAYCKQQKIYLLPATQKLLFQKLLQNVWNEWGTKAAFLSKHTPKAAFLAQITHLQSQLLIQSNNAADVLLLQSKPFEVVVKYEAMIVFVVNKKLKHTDDWTEEDRVEVVANIREKLLSKLVGGRILKQFKGDSLFSTYLYRVIYHCMVDEIRKRKYNVETSPIEVFQPDYFVISDQENYKELTDEYLQMLELLIKSMFKQKRNRFEFGLQGIYQIKMKAESIQRLYANCEESLLVEILSYFGINNDRHLSYAQIYELLSRFISELELLPKPILPSALRVWFQKYLAQIKQTVFENVSFRRKSDADQYFEILVHKLYHKE